MEIIRQSRELHKINKGSIAFVPTMGALHAGHGALIERAREMSDQVVVSIFVNPLQFSDPADLLKYPQSPEADAQIAAQAGATALWLAQADEIYPGEVEMISAGQVGSTFEGAAREGHFAGVLTVVKRLFDLVAPKWALFGEKDFQQLFLINQMVHEEKLAVNIESFPTQRGSNGLALSSRNERLNEAGQVAGLCLYRALSHAAEKVNLLEMQEVLEETLRQESAFTLDYAAIIDEKTFQLAEQKTPAKRALVAGWINGVRLIDNMGMANMGMKVELR